MNSTCEVDRIKQTRQRIAERILHARKLDREYGTTPKLARLAIGFHDRPLPIHRLTPTKLVGRAVACVRTIRTMYRASDRYIDLEGQREVATYCLYENARRYLRLAREIRSIDHA